MNCANRAKCFNHYENFGVGQLSADVRIQDFNIISRYPHRCDDLLNFEGCRLPSIMKES